MPLALATIAAALSLVLSPARAVVHAPNGIDTGTVRQLERQLLELQLPGFSTRAGRRFIVVSDLPSNDASRTLLQLEATADAVERFAADLDIECRPITSRLVSMAFSDRGSFEQFAKDVDHVDASWMAGYWIPGADRTVFRRGGASSSPAGPHRSVLATATSADGGTVAHEAAHQLLHRLGVQRRSPHGPLWLSEGLAMGFEGCANGATDAFVGNTERQAGVRELLRSGRLPSLTTMIVTPRLPSRAPRDVEAFYTASWSLATFLFHHERDGFRRYLAALRDNAGNLNARRNGSIFVECFGPVAAIETRWHASITSDSGATDVVPLH